MKYIDYARKMADTMINRYEAKDLPPENTFFYHQGVFLAGMYELYKATGDEKYYNYVKNWVDSVVDEDGDIIGYSDKVPFEQLSEKAKKTKLTLDHKQPVILLFPLYEKTGDERYKKAIETVITEFKKWKTNELGGYWHMETQPNQMWLDSVYMAGPMSLLYDKFAGDEDLKEKAIDQIMIMHENMMDYDSGLYYHGFDPSKKTVWSQNDRCCSTMVWGRALGWYAVTLADFAENLDKSNPRYDNLIEIEKNLLENLAKYQDKKTKMWCQVVTMPEREGNWEETSCTCLFAYAFKKAARLGIVDKSFESVAYEAFEGLKKHIKDEEEFILENVCTGTCIDEGDYDHYINRPVCENDLHGAGAFLLMCTELNKK